MMNNNGDCCEKCSSFSARLKKHNDKKEKNINTPAKPNAPLSRTHPNKVALALKGQTVGMAWIEGIEGQLSESKCPMRLQMILMIKQ